MSDDLNGWLDVEDLARLPEVGKWYQVIVENRKSENGKKL